MSRRFEDHYPDPSGLVGKMAKRGSGSKTGIYFASGESAPTASAAGFAPGCIFINRGGSVGSLVYANTGTNSSATWTNIV